MIDTNKIIEKKIIGSVLYRDMQHTLEKMNESLGAMAASAGDRMSSDLSAMLLSGGKRLRPILAYVCYRIGGKRDIDITPLMCMLELMHTASLIHDDVVDGAGMRRGKHTINHQRGNFTAVQSGDFLLAKAMELLHTYKGTGINEMLADVSYNMTIGELEQQSMRYMLEQQSVESYFDLIKKKTALLLAASCWCGAIAGGMDAHEALSLFNYGEKLGLAFQLRDDLIDYSDKSGKLPGQDIRNGTYTLPILLLAERGMLLSHKESLVKREKSESEVESLLEYVKRSEELTMAEQLVYSISMEAVAELGRFPDSLEKKGLSELALSLAERNS